MFDSEPLVANQAFANWMEFLQLALTAFEDRMIIAKSASVDDGLAHLFNAYVEFYLSLVEANETVGLPLTKADIKSIVFDFWPTREIDLGLERALATKIAYADNFRLSSSGTKDSRIEAAMMVAAEVEGLESSDPVETVRKSIQRYRRKIKGMSVFQLDRETLTIQRLDAERSLLEGLPGKKGRPRRSD
ncbi:hypothetical protein GCM10023115_03150 [Pontixanthobacter gangjinensis]|uniref:Uncharacterized protein n=1 Tax=Pontixanthobacter gangjinensis TaxID=1028742 RepID=A0A6I4SIP8_9SPHN|nr:hypothetical protein [Pontixanthobacter gangjinensis]MXO55569.1 hypothetical protein [Pontixanthobacter gangjinensis]